MTTTQNVHTEHCCFIHGCRYGNNSACPVASGDQAQRCGICEECDYELTENDGLELAYLLNEMYDKGYAAAEKIADDEIEAAVKNAMSDEEIR